MNYLEAVKELVENPKAVCICFPAWNNPNKIWKLKLNREKGLDPVLCFFGDGAELRANNPHFILRTDFWVEYKAEETVQQAHKRGYYEGYADGVKAGKSSERAAFKQFKQDMKKLFGEDF